MKTARTDLEIRLLTALRRIAAYDTPEKLRKNSEKNWGCSYYEAIEMAYDNIQEEARRAAFGIRLSTASAA
jgi:hypothetical protein